MVELVQHFRAIVVRLNRAPRLRSNVASDDVLRALAVMGAGPDRNALQAIFDEAGWVLTIADAPGSAVALPREGPVPIVFCERELKENDWREMVSRLARLSSHPCVILLSCTSDKNLWDELGRCGGCDILRTPIEREAVMRAVRAGWSLWKNQQRLRLPAKVHQ